LKDHPNPMAEFFVFLLAGMSDENSVVYIQYHFTLVSNEEKAIYQKPKNGYTCGERDSFTWTTSSIL